MVVEEYPQAAVAAVSNDESHDDEDDDSEAEDVDDDELTPMIQQPPRSSLAALQTDEAFDEDEEEEEEDEVASMVNVSVAGDPPPSSSDSPEPKRCKIEIPIAAEEKKPPAIDDSRRLFQRLWTDEDEIELLQGFLEYTTRRGSNQHHHHDTTLFYDQIKGKLQLEFNKNQLVEKLRRLKKKYRNAVNRISSGKDFAFKSPHDQVAFEISRKIWSNVGNVANTAAVGEENITLEEIDASPNPNPNPGSGHLNNDGVDGNENSSEKKTPMSRKRSRIKCSEKPTTYDFQSGSSVPRLVEETVRSCLTPLFTELCQSAMSGPCGFRGLAAGLNPMPLGFGMTSMLNLSGWDMSDEKWRKQQILELEVYSKRLELVQDQVKSALEELKSMGG